MSNKEIRKINNFLDIIFPLNTILYVLDGDMPVEHSIRHALSNMYGVSYDNATSTLFIYSIVESKYHFLTSTPIANANFTTVIDAIIQVAIDKGVERVVLQ